MADKSPDAFRTISEVADWLGVQPHVLRFWESKFSQVKPVKRAGGRRYYRPNDMLLLGGIRKLLHEDGLTIKGAQKVLRESGMAHVAAMSRPLDEEAAALADEAGVTPMQDVRDETFAPEPAAESMPDPAPIAPEPAPAPVQAAPEQPAPSNDAEPALPGFITGEPSQELPADTAEVWPTPAEAAAEPETAPHQPDLEAFDAAPQEPEPMQPAPVEADAAPPAPAPEPEPEPEQEELVARPRIIDAPDPDESTIEVAPAALSAAFKPHALSDQDRATLMPLVAQLAALRDRMAAARGR